MAVYDQTWKEAMDKWFEPFVAFFFANVHRDIDWGRGWQSLDTELRQVTRDAELGERRADKLVKVWRRDGEETWLLIHLEVQSQYESDFPRRMFVYHYRIFDLYNRQVVSLAVLGDDHPKWRPDRFGYDLWGCELSFRFPSVKLLDFAMLRPMLETSADPIAAMVLAHLATLEKPDDDGSRFARKRQVMRSLYDRGMSKQMVIELLRLVHWMMALPEALEPLFRREHLQWEKEKQMPYVTPWERLAREEGRVEGLREGLLEAIELGLKLRFGAEGLQCLPAIQQLMDIDILRRIKQAIETAVPLDDIRRFLP
ncbi:MAG TPA: hypothetical protein VH682_20630 [Gemmataceae bacterium]